jgi:RNA polymerase sigma-70 factor (ECF subfamily)
MLMTGPRPREDLAAITSDATAFRAWYDDAMPRVYAYLYSRTGGDAGLAEELTQQTFIAALRRPESFEGRAETVTWLIGIARHKLVDYFRGAERDRRNVRVVEESAAESPDAAWTAASLRDEIGDALDTLPPDQRLALVLHVVDGLPVRAVAQELGRSEDATESLIRRARSAFRRAYGEPTDV